MDDNAPQFIDGPHGRIAYRMTPGKGPTAIWLGGYASDMLGTKAEALAADAAKDGRAFLRFDYTGHGESEGVFEDGTVGAWAEDAAHAIKSLAPGPKILIGSFMGGWVTLLEATQRPQDIVGIVLIAPAPDFTERLVLPRFSEAQRQTLEVEGIVRTGTSGHPAETYTKALFDDGRQRLLMDQSIALPCPVRILHGFADDVVPLSHVLALTDLIEAPSVTATLVKGGDHRLSEPEDLDRLCQTVADLANV